VSLDCVVMYCYVRRIWALEISFFVPHARDVDRPSSGSGSVPAQSLLSPYSVPARAGSPLLTLITIFGRLRRSLPNHFNSSRRA